MGNIILEVICACVARAIILNNEKVFELFVKKQYKKDVIRDVVHPQPGLKGAPVVEDFE